MDFNKIKSQLQFENVLYELSVFVKADENKEKIKFLEIYKNISEANEEINEVACWTKLLQDEPLAEPEIKDLSVAFTVLKKEGSYLQPQDLIQFAHFLYICGIFKNLIDNLTEEFALLSIKYHNKIFQFRYIENLIKNTFDESGEFYDNASQELKSIRSKLRDTRNKIIEKLNDFIFSGYATDIIQEPIITIRNNRHVVPLKTNFSQKVRGIIQDYSSSGQTVFVEPEFIVQLNNKLAYLKQEEYYEKIRILNELTDTLRDNFYDLHVSYKTLLTIDFKLAKAKLGIKHNWELINLNSENFDVIEAVNPILSIGGKDVVPVNITFKDKRVLIISGANTGGKTVALKTAGLIAIMAQMGLPVPVHKKSKIKFFEKIFIDIGDAQNISEDLSTFSSHITNINSFLKNCNRDSLVLIDELGTGTDPKDGAAIGRALVEYFLKKEAFVIITTHIEDLKYLNYVYEKVENISVDFDEKTIKPKYSLIYGISGRSYAIKIAEKLNLDKEVIALSKSFYNESTSEFLKDIINIEKLKKELIEKEKKLILEKQAVLIEKQKYLKLKDKLVKEKEKIKGLIKAKYEKKFEKLENRFNKTISLLKNHLSAKEYADIVSKAKKEAENIKKEIVYKKTDTVHSGNFSISEFFPGKRVKHSKTGVKGRVLSVDTYGKKLEIILDNNLKIFVPYKDVIPVSESNDNSKAFYESYTREAPQTLFKLNLIGKTVEEAVSEIEKQIDYAILKNADKIEIIHGLGSGKLKKGISDFLSSSEYVEDFYSPIEQSGGLGITIAVLK